MDLSDTKPGATRTIAAFYFAFLSIFATIFIQIILFAFGMGDLVPMSLSFILAIPIAWLSGLIFGNLIIYSNKKSYVRCFLWGVCLLLFALPLYDFLLLLLLRKVHPDMYNLGSGLKDSLILYLLIIIYSFVLIGSWLSIVCGFAAIYLRDRFAPNVLKLSNTLENNHKEYNKNE